jgi:hypothetical protein
MKAVRKVVALAFLLAPAITAPAVAQSWKWDFGVNGGYSWLSKMLDESQTGLADAEPGQSISLAPGWLAGTQLTFWAGSKFGIRANARYGSRDVKGTDMPSGTDFVEDVNLWGATGDLLIRFRSPASEFTKMEVLPYLALGIGGKWHNPGGDQFTCTDAGDSDSCGPFTVAGTTTTTTFAVKDGMSIAGLIGLGADWRLSRNLALRTELTDQLFTPKVMVVTPGATADSFTVTTGSEDVAKMVHEVGAQIGLHFLFGVPRAQTVAVVIPPPAPPPPAPEPAYVPPPAPRSESVSVCVIDPTLGSGIRTESALFYPSRGDTVVVVNGNEVALRNSVGNVMVASNADWYIRGQPLTMTIGRERMEYVTYGTAHMVQASDLAYLGTVNGVPVYADRDEVSDIRDELEDLNRAQRGADLARLLQEHKNLRDELSKVKVLYVPLQSTGCVFQPLQLQEQVRKNRE